MNEASGSCEFERVYYNCDETIDPSRIFCTLFDEEEHFCAIHSVLRLEDGMIEPMGCVSFLHFVCGPENEEEATFLHEIMPV